MNYVGITGITEEHQINYLKKFFRKNNASSHELMLGFLVSHKTATYLLTCGEEGFQNNPGNPRYPDINELSGLLKKCSDGVFKTIHYNTKNLGGLFKELSAVLEYDDIIDYCDGVQFNIVCPPVSELKKIKKTYSDLKLIFQWSHRVSEKASNEVIAEKLGNNYSFMDYVLIDPSGGRGKEMDLSESVEKYELLRSKGFVNNIGFAGGLNPQNITSILSGLESFLENNDFSIDAESGLRTNNLLDLNKVSKYFKNVLTHNLFSHSEY